MGEERDRFGPIYAPPVEPTSVPSSRKRGCRRGCLLVFWGVLAVVAVGLAGAVLWPREEPPTARAAMASADGVFGASMELVSVTQGERSRYPGFGRYAEYEWRTSAFCGGGFFGGGLDLNAQRSAFWDDVADSEVPALVDSLERHWAAAGLRVEEEGTLVRARGRGFTIRVRLPRGSPVYDFELNVRTDCYDYSEWPDDIP